MQPSAMQLQELKAATGITDFGAVTSEQFNQVVTKAGEHRLSLDQLTLLVQVMPHIVRLLSETIGGLKKAAEGAQAGRQGILHNLDALNNALHVLAHNAQTDETRLEIAKIALQAAEIHVRLNDVNNAFWLKVVSIAAGTVGTVAAVGLAVLLAAFSGGRVNGPRA